MIKLKGKYSEAIVYHDYIDEIAMSQIIQMLNSPGITNPVRIMPDFHAGKGSVIGFTMPVGDFVIPNIVGVDIGCGMLTGQISPIKISLPEIDKRIREFVPVGSNIHNERQINGDKFYPLAERVGVDINRLNLSIGTLGGGNHFIEIGISDDMDGDVYVTIHSGSRNFGKMVAEYYQNKAKDFSGNAPDVIKGMEYLPSGEYIDAMVLAQEYASLNRSMILSNVQDALNVDILSTIECIHNYISPKDKIIRKGAVSAHDGDSIILPFNRSEGIWIMSGKDNPDWNFSAPHGAGRRMSRGQAKRELNQEDVDKEMKEAMVFSTYNPIDEAPAAYKSSDEIKSYIGETADFLFAIKPVLNIKG